MRERVCRAFWGWLLCSTGHGWNEAHWQSHVSSAVGNTSVMSLEHLCVSTGARPAAEAQGGRGSPSDPVRLPLLHARPIDIANGYPDIPSSTVCLGDAVINPSVISTLASTASLAMPPALLHSADQPILRNADTVPAQWITRSAKRSRDHYGASVSLVPDISFISATHVVDGGPKASPRKFDGPFTFSYLRLQK